MQLFLMRHGIAADLGGDILDDASRPLTPEGHTKTKEAATGLLRCGSVLEVIATSPLLRARQTGEIVRNVYKTGKATPKLEEWPELEHADYPDLLSRLQNANVGNIMLVGHEPGISRFAAHLLTGSPTGIALEFKKAAVCALELEIIRDSVVAILLWYATPRQLRLMGQ